MCLIVKLINRIKCQQVLKVGGSRLPIPWKLELFIQYAILQSLTTPTVRAQNHKVLWDFPAVLRIPLPTWFKNYFTAKSTQQGKWYSETSWADDSYLRRKPLCLEKLKYNLGSCLPNWRWYTLVGWTLEVSRSGFKYQHVSYSSVTLPTWLSEPQSSYLHNAQNHFYPTGLTWD